MADYEKKDLEKYLKNYISQLQGKSEKEQMDFLSNMRDKRTKEIKAEDPTVEVQYHPELDALGMLYQSVANGNDPKLEYEFDDDSEIVNDKSLDAIKDNFTPPGAKDEEDKEDKESPKERLNPEDLTMKEEHLEKMPPNMRSSWENHIKKVIGANDEDELSSYTKALEDYVSKNKKGREDIPATYKR